MTLKYLKFIMDSSKANR